MKRYVNFMSNPDERTAIDQFGTGDKYFGVATMMSTLPGLPMFGHGQIEGYTEKYGMEYRWPRYEENPDQSLVERHERQIAPLLHQRTLFAESSNFLLYDFSAKTAASMKTSSPTPTAAAISVPWCCTTTVTPLPAGPSTIQRPMPTSHRAICASGGLRKVSELKAEPASSLPTAIPSPVLNICAAPSTWPSTASPLNCTPTSATFF